MIVTQVPFASVLCFLATFIDMITLEFQQPFEAGGEGILCVSLLKNRRGSENSFDLPNQNLTSNGNGIGGIADGDSC